MTKYFSQDTPLAGLERMMMSVPGFQKRGGGMMVLCRFHYKKEDVDCTYCRSYMRHTCQESVCPYIPERLEAGTVSYQELAEGCLHMAGHQKLWNRLSSLPAPGSGGECFPIYLTAGSISPPFPCGGSTRGTILCTGRPRASTAGRCSLLPQNWRTRNRSAAKPSVIFSTLC